MDVMTVLLFFLRAVGCQRSAICDRFADSGWRSPLPLGLEVSQPAPLLPCPPGGDESHQSFAAIVGNDQPTTGWAGDHDGAWPRTVCQPWAGERDRSEYPCLRYASIIRRPDLHNYAAISIFASGRPGAAPRLTLKQTARATPSQPRLAATDGEEQSCNQRQNH